MEVVMNNPQHPVNNFTLRYIITPLELIPEDGPRAATFKKALQPLTHDLRRCIVDSMKSVLKQKHIDESIGEIVAAELEEHMARGEYDEFEDSESFARRLSRDAQLPILSDGAYNNSFIFAGFHEPLDLVNPREKEGIDRQVAHLRRINYGLKPVAYDTSSVAGRTIATLPLTSMTFMQIAEARNHVGKLLSSVADADALVLDLRGALLAGGIEPFLGFVLAYLLAGGPYHLIDLVDRYGEVQHSISTVADDKLPPGTKRFGGQKPLFILVNDRTIFAAADLAYHLQNLGRATAVIGEGSVATRIVEIPNIEPEWICEREFGEKWWMISVPRFRRVDAITGTNWGSIGVLNDIVAGEGEWEEVEDAMEVARTLAVRILDPAQEEL
jgi:hypothetical protein